ERYGERQGPVVAVVDPGIEPSPAHPEGLVPDDVQPFRGEGPRGDLGVGLWRRRGRQIPSGAHMDRPEEKDERRWSERRGRAQPRSDAPRAKRDGDRQSEDGEKERE